MKNKLRKILTLIFIVQLTISIFSIKSLALSIPNPDGIYNTYKSYISYSENDEDDNEDQIYENLNDSYNYDEKESYEQLSAKGNVLRGYSSNGYFINSYDVKKNANEYNTNNITETL